MHTYKKNVYCYIFLGIIYLVMFDHFLNYGFYNVHCSKCFFFREAKVSSGNEMEEVFFIYFSVSRKELIRPGRALNFHEDVSAVFENTSPFSAESGSKRPKFGQDIELQGLTVICQGIKEAGSHFYSFSSSNSMKSYKRILIWHTVIEFGRFGVRIF